MTNPTIFPTTITLDRREHATCLAALTYWAREGLISDGHEADIASQNDDLVPMTADEIAALCDRINTRDASAPTMRSVSVDLLSSAAEYIESLGEITEAPEDSDCWDVVDALRSAYRTGPASEPTPTTREALNEKRIAIYSGHDDEMSPEPVWVGTVAEYWQDNSTALTFSDIVDMLHSLKVVGFSRIGGGAQAAFTIKPADEPEPFVLTAETTFEEFVASKRRVTDLDEIAESYGDDAFDPERSEAALIYGTGGVIEVLRDRSRGAYYLIIERSEWITNDLEALERELYDFAIPEAKAEEEFRQQVEARKADIDLIDNAVEAAINAGCLVIQKAIGQTDGGVAGIYFSGDKERHWLTTVFRDYLATERSHTGGEG